MNHKPTIEITSKHVQELTQIASDYYAAQLQAEQGARSGTWQEFYEVMQTTDENGNTIHLLVMTDRLLKRIKQNLEYEREHNNR